MAQVNLEERFLIMMALKSLGLELLRGLTATKVSPIYLYEEVSIFMGVELSTVFGEFRTTPVDKAADRIVSRVYTNLKKSFDEWNEYYGLGL